MARGESTRMIHLVASGPSVLTSWKNELAQPNDIVCAISGSARYVDNTKLDWWVVADRHTAYSPLLDPPNVVRPKIGILTDAPSSLCFHGSGMRIEVHDNHWPLPDTRRRFSAPCAAVWLLEAYPDHNMTCYGVDLCGTSYAWKDGPSVDTPASLIERWEIERRAWRTIVDENEGRVFGLPDHLWDTEMDQKIAEEIRLFTDKEERKLRRAVENRRKHLWPLVNGIFWEAKWNIEGVYTKQKLKAVLRAMNSCTRENCSHMMYASAEMLKPLVVAILKQKEYVL
jgi:hypothetical protein